MIKLLFPLFVILLFISCGSKVNNVPTYTFSFEITEPTTEVQKKINVTLAVIDSIVSSKYRDKYKVVGDNAYQVKDKMDWFCGYCKIWEKRLIKSAGGTDKNGMLIDGHNSEATNKLLVKEKGGDTLETYIKMTRKFLLLKIRDPDSIGTSVPLRSVPIKQTNDSDHWQNEQFEMMPVATALLFFDKLENDARITENIILQRIIEEAEHR